MTPLPPVLQSEFCVSYVEDIPYDVRLSHWNAVVKINTNPNAYPNADWDAIDAKADAMNSVAFAWLNPHT